MVNIGFLSKYLKYYFGKNTSIYMKGFINTKICVNIFKFSIYNNKLIIKDNKNVVLKIIFNEVRTIKLKDDNLIIEFNFDEKIIIQKAKIE